MSASAEVVAGGIGAKTWDQRLFTLLWAWLAFRTLLPWLVFFRLTFEGDSYSWGSEYFGRMFHSSGLSRPDFLIVYGLLAASLVLIWFLRQQRFRIGARALVIYLGVFAANALYQSLAGKPVIFNGDTLGVRVNVGIALLVFNVGMFLLALAWWRGVRDVPQGPGPRALTPVRRWIIGLCVAVVPVQLALLMTGEPHGTTDEIGVIVTLCQWALLAYALYPGNNYRRI